MGRFAGLELMRRFGLMVIHLCAVVLVVLALVNMSPPPAPAAPIYSVRLTPLLSDGTTPTLVAASPTSSASAHPQSESQTPANLSWLVEGLAVAFLILVGFGLILFPIVVRSSRIERRRRLAFPLAPVAQEKLEAQLSRVTPERKTPLSREQMQALRAEALGMALTPQSSSVRLVNGLPLSLPIAEAEPLPQLPAPRQPVVTRKLQDSAQEVMSDRQG